MHAKNEKGLPPGKPIPNHTIPSEIFRPAKNVGNLDTIAWTEFADHAALTATTTTGTWPEMVERLRTVGTFPSKAACPWIKGATFGKLRTEKKSLRHNENMLAIFAIEGDYDAGAVTIEQARAMLESHGIRAALYPGPSSTAAQPRWRVIAPLAAKHMPGARAALVARLNGALGGILAGESFTASQSYYFGGTPTNDYRVLLTFGDAARGECVDDLDELDDVAINKAGKVGTDATSSTTSGGPLAALERAVEDAGRKLATGDGRRDLLKSAIATYSAQGMQPDMVRLVVDGAIAKHFDPTDPPSEKDVNDLIEHFAKKDGRGDVLADFNDISTDEEKTEAALLIDQQTGKPKKRFAFSMMGEIKKRPRAEWLIKNVCPYAEVGSVVGETGSGKSFIVLDMVLAIARGAEWNGKRVRQGNVAYVVAYVVAEGGGRFDQRTTAYGIHHKIDVDVLPAFQVLTAAPSLMVDKDVRDLLSALDDMPNLKVVVLDTLAQVTPGANENSGEDMGKALATAKRIHKRTGATVLIVAHTGKDASRGMRGWSGMKAAMDFEITVERAGDYRAATVTKMKDGGGEGAVYPFKLNMVDLGYLDDDEEEVQSCIVECGTTGPRPTAKKVKLDDDDRRVLQSAEALVSFGDVTRIEWREDALRKLGHVVAKNRHRKVDSAILKLITGGHIVCGDGDSGLVEVGIPVVQRGAR
jgi:hypothetical protein